MINVKKNITRCPNILKGKLKNYTNRRKLMQIFREQFITNFVCLCSVFVSFCLGVLLVKFGTLFSFR